MICIIYKCSPDSYITPGSFLALLYKWIMTLFITNRRLFHMPRIYNRLFRKCEQLFFTDRTSALMLFHLGNPYVRQNAE